MGTGRGTPLKRSYSYNQHGSMTSMPHLSSMGWMPAMGIKQPGKENVDAKEQNKNKKENFIGNSNSQYGEKKLGEQIFENASKFTDAKEEKNNKEWAMPEVLTHITKGSGSGATEAYYCYDSEGQRVRKVVVKGNIVEERLYLNGFEIFRSYENEVLKTERETLHIMDDKRRIAVVDTLTVNNGTAVASPEPVQRYQLSNNIESATLELDENASIISYEEYYPYGETSYRAGRSLSEVSQKRYRYTGKERDEESGLYYFGARYYSSATGIFISADPLLEKYPNISPYAYCMDNPVKYIDPDGKKVFAVTEDDQKTYPKFTSKLNPAQAALLYAIESDEKIILYYHTVDYRMKDENGELTSGIIVANEEYGFLGVISIGFDDTQDAFEHEFVAHGSQIFNFLKIGNSLNKVTDWIEENRIDLEMKAYEIQGDPKTPEQIKEMYENK